MAFEDDYTDIHRLVLQMIMNHGILTEEKFETIFRKICESHQQPEQNLQALIDLINARISRFDQKIARAQFGLDEVNYFMFCSTASTSVTKMQHVFTEHEVNFFKAIFLQVASSEDLSISPREALNLSNSVKVNKVRGEKLIENWCTGGYFKRQDNMIYLGPRAVTEFKEELKSMKHDLLKCCTLCGDIAAWGIACGNCKTAVYHKTCIEKFIARSDKCPSCKSKWKANNKND